MEEQFDAVGEGVRGREVAPYQVDTEGLVCQGVQGTVT